MPISFTCPHCGRQTTVADQYVGQSGPCAGCGRTITIPGVALGAGPSLAAPPASGSSTPGWTVALVICGVIAGLCLCGGVVVLLPAVQKARESAHRAACANNLRMIGLAMQQYQQQYGTFPPAYVADENGRPKHSWRALVLPYLDPGMAGQYDYDVPWDSPHNSRLANQMPAVFACPSQAGSTQRPTTTSYLVINGRGAIFDGQQATGLGSISDGLANTLLVVEALDAEVPWLEPRDLNLGQVEMLAGSDDLGISSHHAGGANVLMADGTVHFLPETTPAPEVAAMVTAAGGEPVTPP